MTASTSSDLPDRVAAATKNYRRTWRPVDVELYDLCRRLPDHRDRGQVYTKVVTVGRVYAAGISRTLHDVVGDAEGHVAGRLTRVEVAEAIERFVTDHNEGTFSPEVATSAVTLHGLVVRELATSSRLTSFVSKYLHFHCKVVPIYDSRAVDQLRAELRRYGALGRRQALWGQLRRVASADSAYGAFVSGFLALKEVVGEAMAPDTVTVKELDHFLWHASSRP